MVRELKAEFLRRAELKAAAASQLNLWKSEARRVQFEC